MALPYDAVVAVGIFEQGLGPGIGCAQHGLILYPVRAFLAKIESPETLYSQVLTQFRTQNRFPLSLELL